MYAILESVHMFAVLFWQTWYIYEYPVFFLLEIEYGACYTNRALKVIQTLKHKVRWRKYRGLSRGKILNLDQNFQKHLYVIYNGTSLCTIL